VSDLKQQIALTALNEMMSGNHFNICTIDRVGSMLGVNPKGDAYSMLSPLHCIDWAKMPPEVREAVPSLIQECLGVSPVFKFKTLEPLVIEVSPAPKKPGVLQRLGLA
jgi:hypothetical protein